MIEMSRCLSTVLFYSSALNRLHSHLHWAYQQITSIKSPFHHFTEQHPKFKLVPLFLPLIATCIVHYTGVQYNKECYNLGILNVKDYLLLSLTVLSAFYYRFFASYRGSFGSTKRPPYNIN